MGALGNVTIRCASRKHFEVEPGATGVARLICRECRRHDPDGAVTVHHFDLATGRLIKTKRYRSTDEYFTEQRHERTSG